MKNLIALFFAIFFISLSCKHQNESTLAQDPIIQTVFSDNEIESLERVLEYFKLEVIKIQNPNDINDSQEFEQYLQQIRNNAKSSGDMYSSLRIEEEHRKVLISELKNSGLFNELYEMDTVWLAKNRKLYTSNRSSSTGPIVKIWFMYKFDGKYHQLIKESAKYDSLFLEFAKTYNLAGDFVGLGKMVYDFEDFDLTADRVQLFYALSFLRIDEPLPKIER